MFPAASTAASGKLNGAAAASEIVTRGLPVCESWRILLPPRNSPSGCTVEAYTSPFWSTATSYGAVFPPGASQTETTVPSGVRVWMRSFPMSATTMFPCESTAIPPGLKNWPLPGPVDPHFPFCVRSDARRTTASAVVSLIQTSPEAGSIAMPTIVSV